MDPLGNLSKPSKKWSTRITGANNTYFTASHIHTLPEQISSLPALLLPEPRPPFFLLLRLWGPLGSKEVTVLWKECHPSDVFQRLRLFFTHHWGSRILNRTLGRKGPLWRHPKSAGQGGAERRGKSIYSSHTAKEGTEMTGWKKRWGRSSPGCDRLPSSAYTQVHQGEWRRMKELQETKSGLQHFWKHSEREAKKNPNTSYLPLVLEMKPS